MARTLARGAQRRAAVPEPRRRLTWPDGAPRVGIHLGVASGLLKAGRRARQIGATALQIFSDNPTAWRRRAEPPADAPGFVTYAQREQIAPIAIHASYLINLAGTYEPYASQSLAGLIHEVQRAPQYGASLVNTHIGSHRGDGSEAGLERITRNVASVLTETPPGVQLVLENSSGGGDNLGSRIEELARILETTAAQAGDHAQQLSFCLDTAHLWGAGYDIATAEGVAGVLERFGELIGLERLRLVHLNDSKSERGSRTDRHEHLGAGQIGPVGLTAMLRDPRLAAATTFVMETPGTEDGYDAVNLRRAWLLYGGATELPILPASAFRLSRRSTHSGPPRGGHLTG
jgi:deoxyribonuclease-4